MEESGRGFSFQKDEPLDMRFNPRMDISATEVINTWPPEKLVRIIREYGEEKLAERIVKAIEKERSQKTIKTSGQLTKLIERVAPRRGKIHPATKTFQALRVAVNQELINLEQGLQAAVKILKPGGRLVIITFQGLEDIIVKKVFREAKQTGALKVLTKNVVRPGKNERLINPRARSAKLRAAEKLIPNP